jgi:hypothetical protein
MDEPRDPATATSEGDSRGEAGTASPDDRSGGRANQAGGDTATTQPSGLDAGGHEPAPPSDDPVTQEARDGIQHEFDALEATVSSDAIWDEAARRADEQPAPGTSTEDGAAGSPATGADAGPSESP